MQRRKRYKVRLKETLKKKKGGVPNGKDEDDMTKRGGGISSERDRESVKDNETLESVVGKKEKNGLSVTIRPFGQMFGSESAASAYAQTPSSSALVYQ
jgi:hypothetical protein